MTYKILPSNLSFGITGLSVPFMFETAITTADAAGTSVDYYTGEQNILHYNLEATANWSMDLTWTATVPLDSKITEGQAIRVLFLATQGATPFYNDNVLVDGHTSGVTVFWEGGSAPVSGNANGIDAYAYTVIKTDIATFTVLASQTRFG